MEGDLKTRVLQRIQRDGGPDDRPFPTVRPRDAATLILVDRSGASPRVLLGKRHAGHRFMPGKYVFPGGRIEASDRRMAAASELDPVVEAKLLAKLRRPSGALGRTLALAAIRETFEETGLVLGAPAAVGARPAPEGPWREYSGHGFAPLLGPMRFIARAITPPGRPKRFDTRFLTMDASHIAHRVEGVVGPDTELVDLVWASIAETNDIDLPPITRSVLDELQARIAAGFDPALPAPFFYRERRGWRREEL